MEAEDLGGMGGGWLLLIGSVWGRRCHVFIEGHPHKQKSLGAMPMDKVESIVRVSCCWNTCRLKGVEKSLKIHPSLFLIKSLSQVMVYLA